MKFYNIFFSPTGGTKKVVNIVAKGTKLDAEEIDLIKEPDKLMKVNFEKEDLCLVAVPSYGGRIPSTVTDMFCNVKADGTKAILVAVFGNRAIDDTLLELQDVLGSIGLCVYRRHGGCCRTFSDAPIWNRTPGSAGRKGITGICRKDHAKRRNAKDT